MNVETATGRVQVPIEIPALLTNIHALLEESPSGGTSLTLDVELVQKIGTDISFYKPPFEAGNQQTYGILLQSLVGVLGVVGSEAEMAAAADLVVRLMDRVPLAALAPLATDDVLQQALASPSHHAQRLGVEVLLRRGGAGKADDDDDDDQDLEDVVGLASFRALVECWLGVADVDTAASAQRAIVTLLRAETRRHGRPGSSPTDIISGPATDEGRNARPPQPISRLPAGSRHRLWGEFLFGQAGSRIRERCEVMSQNDEEKKAEEARSKSLAQGRLLGILPQLAELDFEVIYAAELPPQVAINGHAGGHQQQQQLLWWVSHDMVPPGDEAMARATVEFYKAMARAVYAGTPEGGAPSPWFAGYVARLRDSEQAAAAAEMAARELEREAAMDIAREHWRAEGEDDATRFGEWFEAVWNGGRAMDGEVSIR